MTTIDHHTFVLQEAPDCPAALPALLPLLGGARPRTSAGPTTVPTGPVLEDPVCSTSRVGGVE